MSKTLIMSVGVMVALTVSACSGIPTMQSPENRLGDVASQPRSTAAHEIQQIQCDLLDEGEDPRDVYQFFADHLYMIPFSDESTAMILTNGLFEMCPEHVDAMLDYARS